MDGVLAQLAEQLALLFGSLDENIETVAQRTGARIGSVGTEITVTGTREQADLACTVLENDVYEYQAQKPFGYMTEALDDLKPNEIYIATGAHNSALWGELLTACGKARGAVGAVLDGYTRDTPKVIEQNFPVFCTGTWAQDSSVRTYVFQWRCPIEIGQVTIHNGDIVFGDIDGVLIIPKEIAPEVLEKALEKASTEKTMRKAIENGMLVTEAFAKFGVL